MLITALTEKIECLACKKRLFYLLTALYYKNIIEREVRLAQIGPGDKILCIGGGPCPFSAIILHQLTGAPVTVVDHNAFCARQAAAFIKGLGLEDSIRVLCCEGEAVNCRGFTVIHLALQVSAKEKVVKNLLDRAEHGAKILVRMPKAFLSRFYPGREFSAPAWDSHVEHNPLTNVGSTVLYVKEGLYRVAQAL